MPASEVPVGADRTTGSSGLLQRSEALAALVYVALGVLAAIVVVAFPAWLVSAILLNWL